MDGAGKLIASEQIHVLTMMNVITNLEYIKNIGVAEKTATGKKLHNNFGVNLDGRGRGGRIIRIRI